MNLKTASEELEAAKIEGKPKKVEKLTEKRESIVGKKAHISGISPAVRRLLHADMIQKLWARLLLLQVVEEKGRSMSLTMADLKTLEEKPDIEEQILQMQNASRGWFEDDADFNAMCEAEEREAKKKFKAKVDASKSKNVNKGKVSSGTSGKSSAAGGWMTTSRGGSKTAVSSTSTQSTRNGFAAAFGGDSDSD